MSHNGVVVKPWACSKVRVEDFWVNTLCIIYYYITSRLLKRENNDIYVGLPFLGSYIVYNFGLRIVIDRFLWSRSTR